MRCSGNDKNGCLGGDFIVMCVHFIKVVEEQKHSVFIVKRTRLFLKVWVYYRNYESVQKNAICANMAFFVLYAFRFKNKNKL
jgi:hypothetical protein